MADKASLCNVGDLREMDTNPKRKVTVAITLRVMGLHHAERDDYVAR